jgi:hypothetical protein
MCKEANILDACSFPYPPTLTVYQLREIERAQSLLTASVES